MTADLRRRLKVSQKEVEDLQAITEQVERVHQAIANRDAKIENQRDTIAKLRTQVDTLKAAAIEAEQKFARREEQLTAQLNTIHIKTDTGGADTEKRNEPAPKKSRKRRARVELQTEDTAPKITDADLVDVEAGFAGHDWFGAPPHKLHLNIKYTTLSLTMIIKQPLNRTGSSASRRHRVGAWALAHGSRNRQLTVRMPAMQVPPGLALRTSRGRRIRLPRRLNRHL